MRAEEMQGGMDSGDRRMRGGGKDGRERYGKETELKEWKESNDAGGRERVEGRRITWRRGRKNNWRRNNTMNLGIGRQLQTTETVKRRERGSKRINKIE